VEKKHNMIAPAELDVLLIGHVTRDRITVKGQMELCIGGGVYYACFPLRSMGLRTGVITRLRPSDAELLAEMKNRDVQVFLTPAAETTQIENIYFADDQEERVSRMTGYAGAFQTSDLPEQPRKVTLVSPMAAGEMSLAFLKEVARSGALALDVQGFVRVRQEENLTTHDWTEKTEGLALATFAKLDRAEAQVLTGLSDPRQAILEVAQWGAREIMLTFNGGVLLYADHQVYQARIAPHFQNGRTGRGDTCFATYVGRRLNDDPVRALHFAAALTSLKLEHPGPFQGTIDDVQERMRETF
jgi:sugar/nucleoside kinase (ribokinase family)